ncbi:unconventional myosin-VIIa-like isoform X1 [Mytilus californianus]|uniref:unconventional myosin-VIIa-like isoform X1 n=1 Tax=Mytilus californianus TaxID=6549 RepID=UPI0022466022|nr:unconventional myosin-VIIa-like isoform X1 [Mytilus californianus]XP_052069099.1 unconventional myosin-VIIa-like isoform X1 [Mytilus californianus]
MGESSNDSDAAASSETSIWSMGDNPYWYDTQDIPSAEIPHLEREFQSNSQYYDSDIISSSTETWSWGDNSSCYSTWTNGSSSDSNISDMQKLRDQRSAVDMSVYSCIEDLTHLVGPMTEDTVVRCLQARFYSHLYQNKIGPVIVSVNCNRHKPSYKVMVDPDSHPSLMMKRMIKEAVSQHSENGHSQAVIVSGESGSGKTHCAMQLLRQLFDIAGGGPETDAFKHLSATLTVLRSLTSAATITNPECSRAGMFVENFLTDAAIYRTKVHAYLLDRSRVCSIQRFEKNYHIFYQMLSGLSAEEKAKLHLTGHSVHNLRYLSCGNTDFNDMEDKSRFDSWKLCLSVLGIPFSDVMRIFAAVLLLGNVEFVEGTGLELDIVGNNEIKAVAALLGVSGVALYRGFTTKTRNTRGQVCKALADVNTANATRDSFSKSLYCRTVSAILKRANSLKRPSINSLLSDSTESNIHQEPTSPDSLSSRRPSLTCSTSSQFEKTRYDGFISIVDMFGFEVAETNQLEQLCINLCAETIQHFYNTHIFKSTMESLREEEVQTDVDVNYFDNDPILELLSSPRSGIFNILDTECTQPKTSSESFVSKVKIHHRVNNYFFEPLPKSDYQFGIRHFSGRVVYDANNFLPSNRDHLPDDIMWVLSKQNCNFGFATHLFNQEIKQPRENGPKGLKHRILPGGSSKSESKGSVCSDFQLKINNLLKTLVHAKCHFVQCIKSNDRGEMDLFDKDVIIRQLRSLQILETVHLMAGGIPHRMRFKLFNHRYRVFMGLHNPYQLTSPQDQCKIILEKFLKAMDESKLPYVSTQWRIGKKHIFFSEGTRQQLEAMRQEKIHNAAALIQAHWRGLKCRLEWKTVKPILTKQREILMSPKPQSHKKDTKKPGVIKKEPYLLDQASKYYNISLEAAPDIPNTRSYCVNGQVKLSYPQIRVLKHDYSAKDAPENVLRKGSEVRVVGPSAKKGHLIVDHKNICFHVPYQMLDIKSVPELPGMNI